MSILPRTIQELVNFGNDHYPGWVTNATGIGLSAPAALAFKNAAIDLTAKFTAVAAARTALRNAVMLQNDSVAVFREIAGEDLRIIKAFAESQPVPATVYTLANIPAPAIPSPLPPPGQPNMITATLDGTGSITLKWKCANPVGGGAVAYILERRLATTGPNAVFDFIGIGGAGRTFTDETIPAGSTYVEYRITAQRGAVRGTPSIPFPVTFGGVGGGGGGMFIISQGDEVMKQAA